MKKKKIAQVLAALLATGAVVSLASCKPNDNVNPEPTPEVLKYTVTYNANGHGTAPAEAKDLTNLPSTLPTLTDNDYDFGGWYKDAACTQPVTAGEALTANITLYAKWTAKAQTPDTPDQPENPDTPDTPDQPDTPSESIADNTIIMNGKQYETIGEALSAIPTSGDTSTYVIKLGKGTYNENGLGYKGTASIKISGYTTAEHGSDVIIAGVGKDQNSTRTRPLFEMDGSGNLILENLTLKNTFTRKGATTSNTQAEALGHDSTGTVAAYNCSFISHQDTIRTVSKAWFYGCYIEGDVDFLWCEASSIVALYENCKIKAVADESTSAYITAPKYASAQTVGKGLVIFNSTVEIEDGLEEAYLFRNPWSSDNANNTLNTVAYVGTTVTGKLKDLAKSAALKKSDDLGYQIDETLKASLSDVLNKNNVSTMSNTLKQKEYAGRNNILNRMYNHTTGNFAKDISSYWDFSTIISENNWDVVEDTSKALLDGETELVVENYVFDGKTDYSSLCSGFALESGKTHYVGQNGSTIRIPVTGKCSVSVTGYYKGNGTIKAGNQVDVLYDFNNGLTSKLITKDYLVYDETTNEVVITASGTSYITKITVIYDNSIVFKPVETIKISPTSNSKQTVGVPYNLQVNVGPSSATIKDVIWSSSDETIATVDQSGTVTFLKAGNVTIIAVAKDGSGISDEYECNPEAATWTSAEWYFDKDGTGSSGSGVGCKAEDIKGSNSSAWTVGKMSGITIGRKIQTQLLDGTSVDISTGLKMDSNGKLTISVTKNAVLTVKQAYLSSSNGYLIISSTDGTATASDSNPTAAITEDSEYTWTLTPGTYNIIRKTGGTGPIYYAKVEYEEPVIEEDTTISFGTNGNSNTEIPGVKIACTNTSNGGNNSQLKQGTITLNVIKGSKITIEGNYYVRYSIVGTDKDGKIEAGNGTEDPEVTKEFIATSSKVVITCDPDSTGKNYFYNVKVTCPEKIIEEDTTFVLGSNNTELVEKCTDNVIQGQVVKCGAFTIDATNGKVRLNGGDNAQVNTGTTITFKVARGATVTIEGYPGLFGYSTKVGNGEEVTATTVTTVLAVTTEEETIIVIKATDDKYLKTISITFAE